MSDPKITPKNPLNQTAIIVGASAGVGRALASEFARHGYNLLLIARDMQDLEAVAKDLKLRYSVQVDLQTLDLADSNFNGQLAVQQWFKIAPTANTILLPAGVSFDDDDFEISESRIDILVATNFLSIIKLIKAAATHLITHDSATIVVFSTIAAGRPRKRNLTYAAAKSGLEAFCKGIQHQLSETKVRLQVYRLGYVDTALTFGQKLLFPIVSPKAVASHVIKNLHLPQRLAYFPSFWRVIVTILQLLPWAIFSKLKF